MNDIWTALASANPGDRFDYADLDGISNDMVMDETVSRLRARGLRLNREDTDCVWVEAIEAA
jgi:hypothetical protein